MAAEPEQHLFVKTLPPALDYVNYLILLEHNLSKENLPTLHEVLQDSTLTINIGWDLIHLLLPLLPESAECLHDIARLGNPREVVLKVTESLRLLEFDAFDNESASASEDGQEKFLKKVREALDAPLSIHIPPRKGELAEPKRPLPILQFQTMLQMLSTVQPRIKSKVPSRFLSATLQGVLASYSHAGTHMDDLTAAVVKFVKTNTGTQRPHLPPRTSSGLLSLAGGGTTAPDPEAQEGDASEEEQAIQQRLMQSFVTHVLEDYLNSMTSGVTFPGMSWSARFMEKSHPERQKPRAESSAEMYATQEELTARTATLGQLVALAQDLKLDSEDLFRIMTEAEPAPASPTLEEDDPPETADDIPLSKTGALYLFTARKISEVLYDTPASTPTIAIFPTHATLVNNFFHASSAASNPGSIGTAEQEAKVDAILALGLISLEANNIGEPADDIAFNTYLQSTSLLSSNCPSPSLRYHAHYLTATVLRSHPSDIVRLAFIRDTLEHCPFPNLKVSALGWLKGETLDANPPTPLPSTSPGGPATADDDKKDGEGETVKSPTSAVMDDGTLSVFATPVALASVASFVFPDIAASTELLRPETEIESVLITFAQERGFYLSALNFYSLLLMAKHLHETLDIKALRANAKIDEAFVGGLRAVAKRLRDAVDGGEVDEETKGDAMLLEGVLDRVEELAQAS